MRPARLADGAIPFSAAGRGDLAGAPGDIAQDPCLEGQGGVQQAVNALDGKPVTRNIGTPLVAITQQNMNQPSVAKYVYKSSC